MFDELFNSLFDRLPRPLRIGCITLFAITMVAGLVLMAMERL